MNIEGALPDAAPAWYSKLACLGDFASRRLAQDTARLLDAWLAQGVDTSRAQLGERWLNVYLTSPLWRFAWRGYGTVPTHGQATKVT